MRYFPCAPKIHFELHPLELAARILNPKAGEILVLADAEHFSAELLDQDHAQTCLDLLVPNYPSLQKQLRTIPESTGI